MSFMSGRGTPYRSTAFKRPRTTRPTRTITTIKTRGGYRKRRNYGRPRAYSRGNVQTGGYLGIEKKFYDTALQATAIGVAADATGGEFDPSATSMITTPVQGTTEQNRDGKKIVCKYIEIIGSVDQIALVNQTAMQQYNQAFVAVVLDTQSNAAQMNSEDCFKNIVASSDGNAQPFRNLLFGPRFRILKSQRFYFGANNASYDGTNIEIGGQSRGFKWFIPMKNMVINFNAGTTASIANVTDNSVHVIAYANGAGLRLNYGARLRFVG